MENYKQKSTIFAFTALPDSEIYDKMLIEKENGNMVNLFYVKKNKDIHEEVVEAIIDKSAKAGIGVHIIEDVA